MAKKDEHKQFESFYKVSKKYHAKKRELAHLRANNALDKKVSKVGEKVDKFRDKLREHPVNRAEFWQKNPSLAQKIQGLIKEHLVPVEEKVGEDKQHKLNRVRGKLKDKRAYIAGADRGTLRKLAQMADQNVSHKTLSKIAKDRADKSKRQDDLAFNRSMKTYDYSYKHNLKIESLDMALKHQLTIAKATLKMSDAGANILGVMSKPEAAKLVKKHHGEKHARKLLSDAGHTEEESNKLFESEDVKPVSFRKNVAYNRLYKAHHALAKATNEFNAAKGAPQRTKAMDAFAKAKREHLAAKADHDAVRKLAEVAVRKPELVSIVEGTSLLSEVGTRWFEDYHDRAYNVALKASPERIRQSASVLRSQLKKHHEQANLHQKIANDIAEKHGAASFSDITDVHDRHRANYHSAQSDHHRRKEASTYWAHSGLKKAAHHRGLLADDSVSGHYAQFKESKSLTEARSNFGVWHGDGSLLKHPAYAQGQRIANFFANNPKKLQLIKNRAFDAHEKHADEAAHHHSKMDDLLNHKKGYSSEYSQLADKAHEHGQASNKYQALARGIHYAQTIGEKPSRPKAVGEGAALTSYEKPLPIYHLVKKSTGEIVHSEPGKLTYQGNTLPSAHLSKMHVHGFGSDYEILHDDQYSDNVNIGLHNDHRKK